MITDEQAKSVIDVFREECIYTNELAAMRKALESYEASKWVKFDIDDESTHPIDNQVCNVVYHTGQVRTDRWSDLHRFWVYASCQKCVTHWQPLPTFKE